MKKNIRAFAFYLPQFHPFPENDAWWGKGFTEWTNVTGAQPQFSTHYQPHLPTDLGFYDLRLPLVLAQQASMAQEFGLSGFCFYHYWFNGKRLMHRSLDNWLAHKEIDFPFFYCWANENWSRRWDGKDSEILIQQNYGTDDHLQHIHYLLENVFSDPRYLRIDDKPVFAVYRTELIPDIAKVAALWRAEAQKAAYKDLYLIRIESFDRATTPASIGFDAAVDFQPNWKNYPSPQKADMWTRLKRKLGFTVANPFLQHRVYDYQQYIQHIQQQTPATYTCFPSVMPMWDNTARRKQGATIFVNNTPETYAVWLANSIEQFTPPSANENLVFINAWNEWAEGNHLEPCQKWGRAYLEETQKVLAAYAQ
ncbi:MAG: glycoside hydrolase family 99-like domain-containing protein [Chitinophagales bacterium]|nr:glycoside hydrolase family 99-like domain-containing protein [Chitinophagales bacterium]